MKKFIKKSAMALAITTMLTSVPFHAFAGEAEVANFNSAADKLPKAETYKVEDYHAKKDVLKETEEAFKALEEGDKEAVDKAKLDNFTALRQKIQEFIASDAKNAEQEAQALANAQKKLKEIPKDITKTNVAKATQDIKEAKRIIEEELTLEKADKALKNEFSDALNRILGFLKADAQNAVAKFTDEIKFVNGVEKRQVTLANNTKLDGYRVDVKVTSNNKVLAESKNIEGPLNMKLPFIANGSYRIEVSHKANYGLSALGEKATEPNVVAEKVNTLAAPAITAPSLRYAYVYDGGLIVNIKADAGVKNVYWAYSGERYFNQLQSDAGYGKYYRGSSYTNKNDFSEYFKKAAVLDKYTRYDKDDYRINVKIPSTVDILVEDNMGNKTPIIIKVEKDNVALTKSVPEAIVNALKDVTHFTFKNNDDYKDLLVVEKGTIVDLFETFEKHIVKGLVSFNTRNLEWNSQDLSDKIPYTGVYKFDKEGAFNIQVKDTESGKTVEMTVIVTAGSNNIRSYSVTKKEIEVEKDKFKPIETLNLSLYDKGDPNPISFVAVVNGRYYRLTDEIEFKDKDGKMVDKLAVKIVDLKENKSYDVTFIKKAVAKDFPDIHGHWAENMIKELSVKGIISGYNDGKFKPNNKITIRETLLILGKYGQRNDKLCGTKVSNFELLSEKDKDGKENWGYKDIKFATERLPKNIFAGKDITTAAITREEVAYVMKYLYNISGAYSAKQFTDIHDANYADEITALTSQKVIAGYLDNTFRPTLEITRAELSSLLFNLPSSFK